MVVMATKAAPPPTHTHSIGPGVYEGGFMAAYFHETGQPLKNSETRNNKVSYNS